MKKLLLVGLVAFLMSGCAFVAAPVTGVVYTDVQAPYQATSNEVASKVGTAEVTSILGIIASGDASIDAAAKKAGITRISHVDYHAQSILGIYAKFTIYVYGE